MNPRQADEERFGFRWGQVVVTRLAELPKKRKVIGIGTGGIGTRPEIEVYPRIQERKGTEMNPRHPSVSTSGCCGSNA